MEVLQTSALPLGDGAGLSFSKTEGGLGRVYTQRQQRAEGTFTCSIDLPVARTHDHAPGGIVRDRFTGCPPSRRHQRPPHSWNTWFASRSPFSEVSPPSRLRRYGGH